jgi:hypothetical protein
MVQTSVWRTPVTVVFIIVSLVFVVVIFIFVVVIVVVGNFRYQPAPPSAKAPSARPTALRQRH